MAPVRGSRVLVPLGSRLTTGIVLACREAEDQPSSGVAGNLRDIADLLDREAFLPEPILDLALWMADYYMCSPGEAIASAMPPLAWVDSERRWVLTDAGRHAATPSSPERRALIEALGDGRARSVLELSRAFPPVDRSTSRAGDQPGTAGRGRSDSMRRRAERFLRDMEGAGLVRPVQRLIGRADASQVERVVHLRPAAAGGNVVPQLSSKQRDAIEAIGDLVALDGVATVSAAREQGVSPAVLDALARKGLVSYAARRVERVGDDDVLEPWATPQVNGADRPVIQPTEEQAAALDCLTGCLETGEFRVAVLHGVTGSGKTEVYLRLAREVIARGRRVLVLVPEIALTPAVAGRFRAAFGDGMAIQHSALASGERYDQWRRIRRGEVDVVIGTRSAVFAPLDRLGLVIVDEEHDSSYKQEEAPRYHGRDVALVRARDAGALVVLGSATPSLESFHHARAGRYTLVRLTRRVFDRPLADVGIVNMRDELAVVGPNVVLSAALREAVAARLAAGEQAIILLNRRGYATNLFCRQCGDTLECPNCSVSLTVHRRARRARCHYCDYGRVLPEECVSCGGAYLEYQGIGTERVEAEVREAFENARIARVDRDTVRRRGEITRVLRGFARGEIDVLVGTQMIAKGHDFPAVTLVGVVSADVGLGLADFRAAERTFQLLTQVSGRAGRGERRGEALIQTLFPEHYSIVFAQAQDYDRFYDLESHFRRSMKYPPAVWLTNVVVRGRSESDARRDAVLFADALRDRRGFKVLGPAPAPLARLRGYYRVQLLLKGTHRVAMRHALRDALRLHPGLARAITIDVDPLTVL
jgi:primosomal protein N' (replication factor Y)